MLGKLKSPVIQMMASLYLIYVFYQFTQILHIHFISIWRSIHTYNIIERPIRLFINLFII